MNDDDATVVAGAIILILVFAVLGSSVPQTEVKSMGNESYGVHVWEGISTSNANYARDLGVHWCFVGNGGVFDWRNDSDYVQDVSDTIAKIRARGMEPVLRFKTTSPATVAADPTDFKNFVVDWVTTYGLQYIVVLDEPHSEWTPATVAQYVNVFSVVYPAVKAAAPNCKVIGGFGYGRYQQYQADATYTTDYHLTALEAHSYLDYVDCLSVHGYTGNANPDTYFSTPHTNFRSYLSSVGHSDIGVVVTGFGYTTSSNVSGGGPRTEDEQADLTARAATVLNGFSDTEIVCYFYLENTSGTWSLDGGSLINTSDFPKPVYDAYRLIVTAEPETPETPTPTFSVGADIYWGTTASLYNNTYEDLMHECGLTWVRIYMDPSSMSTLRSLIPAIVNSDVQVLGLLMRTDLAPNNHTDFGDWVTTVVNEFKSYIHVWEIWNEPNLNAYFSGTDPDKFINFLEEGYDHAKAADPTCTVLGCAIVFTHSSARTFLERLYQLGAKDHMDHLSYHPYVDGYHSPDYDGGTNPYTWLNSRVRPLMQAYGDTRNIWITEFGYPTNDGGQVGEDTQGSYLVTALEMAKDWGWIDTFIIYNWKDSAASGSATKGLLTTSYTRKQSFYDVQDWIADLEPTPTPTPPPPIPPPPQEEPPPSPEETPTPEEPPEEPPPASEPPPPPEETPTPEVPPTEPTIGLPEDLPEPLTAGSKIFSQALLHLSKQDMPTFTEILRVTSKYKALTFEQVLKIATKIKAA